MLMKETIVKHKSHVMPANWSALTISDCNLTSRNNTTKTDMENDSLQSYCRHYIENSDVNYSFCSVKVWTAKQKH